MIDVFPFAGLPVAVFGLGKSGLVAAKALAESNAEVWAWDDDPEARARAEEAGVPLVDLYAADLSETTTLVLSPGIPLTHPEPHPIVERARKAGLEVIGDIELLGRTQRDAAYIGVTGTNGKSTTTALIGHILETAGREVEVGGNLGTPVLALRRLETGGTYVLEMSSFQLDLTVSITFDVAVLLNISADHLDRHGGMEGYVASKRQIFHRQTDPRTAVVGIDDDLSHGIYKALKEVGDQVVIPVSATRPAVGGVYVQDGMLYDDMEGGSVPVLDLSRVPSLPGTHNHQNAAAAYAAARGVGIQAQVISACMQSFPGLEHRQEPLALVDEVLFVNDSKATNVDAASKALACYDAIYWIAGGRAKPGGLAGIADHLGRVLHAFLIGEAADAFADELEGQLQVTRAGTLEKAVQAAFAMAREDQEPGATVLLSPAAASFDQFEDFEARGEAFRALVDGLPGVHEDPMADVFGAEGA